MKKNNNSCEQLDIFLYNIDKSHCVKKNKGFLPEERKSLDSFITFGSLVGKNEWDIDPVRRGNQFLYKVLGDGEDTEKAFQKLQLRKNNWMESCEY